MAFFLITKGFSFRFPSKNINGWEGILTREAACIPAPATVFAPFAGRLCPLRPTKRLLSLRNTDRRPGHAPLATRCECPADRRDSPTLCTAGLRCLARTYLYAFLSREKCFNLSAACCFSLVFRVERAEGFVFPTLQQGSAVQAAAQVRRWKNRSLRPDFQSADLARQKQGLAGLYR